MKSVVVAFVVHAILLVAWRQLQPDGILFYQGVALALATVAAQLAWLRTRPGSTWAASLKDALLGFLLIYSVLFTVPTTVERAYTVRMLLELQRSPDGLTRAQVEHWFATEFQRQGGVEKRLREQAATGSIAESGGRYRLTPSGQRLAAVFAALRSLYAADLPPP